MNSIEIFAGGGGLALGVRDAGFAHSSLIELDMNSARTLYHNYRNFNFSDEKQWRFNDDIHNISFLKYAEKGLYYNVVHILVNAADYGVPQQRSLNYV